MYVVYLPRITRRITMIGQRSGLNVFSLDSSLLLHQLLHRLGKTLTKQDEETTAAEIVVALGGGGATEHCLLFHCNRLLLEISLRIKPAGAFDFKDLRVQ